MNQKFNKHWNASKQPRKQRKYIANAPLHIKRKFTGVNLSKELRKRYGKRSIPARKGDTIKIMRGKFRKKQGKVLEVRTKFGKIIVEGIQVKKMDGSKAVFPLRASNLQIIELNTDDNRRFNKEIMEKSNKKTSEEKQNAP